MDRTEKLADAHIEEAEAQGAEFYNLGWSQGDDFIHSKTDQGRLYSYIDSKGQIKHQWQNASVRI